MPSRTRTLFEEADGGIVRRSVLPGGLQIITESMPGSRAASFGVWVNVGSLDESPGLAGTSHFLEHVLFKGTPRRDALEISAALEAVGGDLNAFTTKEHTCYYAHVLAGDLPLAVDVVTDVVTNALVTAEDVDGERGVILEEIAMRDDDPVDSLSEAFSEAFFGPGPLGRPVIGTVETVGALTRNQISGYYRRRYRPDQMVIAAAGRLEHADVVRLVRKAFGDRLSGDSEPAAVRRGPSPRAVPAERLRVLHRVTEQANVMLGLQGLSRHDERRFGMSVLSTALGGGASSRLFQEVREKRGLVYSIYAYASAFAATGSFAVYAGCQPGKVDQVLSIVRDELAAVAARGLTREELDRGKGQLRGSLILGLEDAESRMSRLGKSALSYGEVLPIDDLVTRIDAVTGADVQDLAAELMTGPQCLSAVGPFAESDFAALR